MKKMKKFASLLLALVLVFSLAATAFAQEVDENNGTASITIQNAAKGETYKIYKLFDATVSEAQDNGENVSISYTGSIPETLNAYFQADINGYISLKENVVESNLIAALKTWAATATQMSSAVADEAQLTFKNLPYGYYVITSTQGGGSAITVDSTKPNATVVDKNSTSPNTLTKEADKESYNFGDPITYTVKFKTANWNGSGLDAKKIVSYTIEDTLPDFLENVTVTGITIGGSDYKVNGAVPQFAEKKITIPWVENDNFLYANGAEIVITYTAVLTDKAAIDGAGNTNKVTVSWTDGTQSSQLEAQDTVYTYAIAVKKVDQNGNALAGAKFEFPFYVKPTPDTDGAYIYAGTTAGEGLINTIVTPADGVIIVKGVDLGTYSITEVEAPAGYNRLLVPVSVEAKMIGSTTTSQTWIIDEKGNVVETASTATKNVVMTNDNIAASAVLVVNKTGTELPTTGGMGTTLFYTLGSILVVAAVVLLVTKKRMTSAQ